MAPAQTFARPRDAPARVNPASRIESGPAGPIRGIVRVKGAYDFSLEWAPGGLKLVDGVGAASDGAAADIGGRTLFDSVEQLGLKLEARKHTMPVMVIDHIERVPTDN
jgi:uncharacterized protein (TIGR03435 family)